MHRETLDPEHQRVCPLLSMRQTNIDDVQTGDFKEYVLYTSHTHGET